MAILTREQILATDGLVREVVGVPEWGGEVLVQEFTAAQRDRFEQLMIEQRSGHVEANLSNFRAKLAAACMVDEGGKALFSDADVESLGGKSARALQRVVDVAMRINALTDADVEDLTKN